MRRRRPALILLVIGLLLIGAFSASQRDRTPSRSAEPAPSTPATPIPAREVRVSLPAARPVEVRVGDTVLLSVRSDEPDIAKVLAAGTSAPVGPGLPGEMRFLAARAGEVDVHLELAGTSAGIVSIVESGS